MEKCSSRNKKNNSEYGVTYDTKTVEIFKALRAELGTI